MADSTINEIEAKYSLDAPGNDQEQVLQSPGSRNTLISFYLELHISEYYDPSQLHVLINEHPTLQTVTIIVQYEYMWLASSVKDC